MRLRFFLLILLSLAALGLLYIGLHGFHPAVDQLRLAIRHLNQRIHYSLGYPLPGTPDLSRLEERLTARGLKRGDPIFIRIFKNESRLELWMKQKDRFVLFEAYPICFWSGELGPKLREGDRQAPEGFYTVARQALNPNSIAHLSFNLGFPNLYDSSHGRTGSYLMVHGSCSSIGCYAMTDSVITELWALINAAFDAGQKRFAVHVYPFRMTEDRLRAYRDHRWVEFWRGLKPGYDLFEHTHIPPKISVCGKRYVAQAGDSSLADPPALRSFCPPEEPTSG